jgi:vacuolar-type H+-ATPase subunit H
MNTALLILEILAKYGPTVAETAQRIANAKEPTDADWKELFGRAKKPYDAYVEEARKKVEAEA